MAKPIEDNSKLCIHTITTKPWNLEEASDAYAKNGVGGITVWRNVLDGRDIYQTGEMLRSKDLDIVSLCRGGFFPADSESKRKVAIDDNIKMVEEAAELGAPMIVLVCGAEPSQSLEKSRGQIQKGIEAVLPHAEEHNIKLAIEPLHPAYADTRSAINTMEQANDMAEKIDSEFVGVAVDVYHLWWDSNLKREIHRCGENNNLFAFHICDWKFPLDDILNDRGLMGEGCIDVPQIREWVEDTGFDGFNEVEIFSNRYWAMDQNDFLEKIIHAYKHKS
ncbi:sugar phosphate isomerase/epimerase family protein [Membranihabitans maritimus]|uniref:sugar phosphate isomerase/epimerase family protein n=1 Tax=Membranihabitans maritimus TaxID=2904244 RepID=UPI001F454735|nr:sugar phosphate isomerase/epimerase family protein [Membranihabitans maritimus]